MSTHVPRERTAGRTVLSVENLRTAFFTDKETIRAVDGVSFDVREGETVGIVGESGSGKSVTARSIMGLIKSPGRVLDGSIRFRDRDVLSRLVDSNRKRTADVAGLSDEERAAAVDDDDFAFVEEWNGDDPVDGYVDVTRMPDSTLRTLRGNGIAMIFQDPLSSLNPVYTVGNQIKEALRLHQGVGSELGGAVRVGLEGGSEAGCADMRQGQGVRCGCVTSTALRLCRYVTSPASSSAAQGST